MFDDDREAAAAVRYDELADQLLEQGQQSSPATVHGCLCGLLSAGADTTGEAGLDALARALDTAFYGELAEQVMTLYVATAAALADDDFSFQPLLPGDDGEIGPRTHALADWCDGFIAGFAQAAASRHPAAALSEDSREVLEDIGAMAQAEADAGATDSEQEDSYFELVEYLRFAVLNVFAESAAHDAVEPATRTPEDLLH